MRRIAFACVALVSTGCAGILGLDEFTEGEASGPGAGGGTPTTSTGQPTTSTGDGGSGAGTGDGGGGGTVDSLAVTPEGPVKVGVFRGLQFTSNAPATWSVDEPDGGTIDDDGFYVSPDAPGTYHVTATSTTNPEESVTVTVNAAPLALRVLAGTPGGPGTIDGGPTRSRVDRIGGITIADNGQKIVFTDENTHTVRVFEDQMVTTIAGAPYQPGAVDGAGDVARFDRPESVAADPDSGIVYVVDRANFCIRRVNTANGNVTTLAGECGARGHVDATAGADVRFDEISSLVMGPSGDRLYACQVSGTPSIRIINPTTGATTSVVQDQLGLFLGWECRLAIHYYNYVYLFADFGTGVPIKRFDDVAPFDTSTITDIATVPQGSYFTAFTAETGYGDDALYAVDDSTVYKLDLDTPAEGFFPLIGTDERAYADGPFSDARLLGSSAMVARPGYDEIYFGDDASTIRMIDFDTEEVRTVAGQAANIEPVDGPADDARLVNPFAMELDDEGNVYIAEFVSEGGNVIRKVDAATGEVGVFSGVRTGDGFEVLDGAADEATFGFVIDLVRVGDAMYGVDIFANTIRRISISDGSVTTIAGQTMARGFEDGFGDAALFDFENGGGLATDGTDLFVADSLNHAIRKVDLATTEVTTIAGGTEGVVNGTGLDAQFVLPVGMAHVDGVLYIADYGDHVIRQLDLETNEVTTLLGVSGTAGQVDGGPGVATFVEPFRLNHDGLGNLFVTTLGDIEGGDGGLLIRRIDLGATTVAPFAGSRSEKGFSIGQLPGTVGCPTSLRTDASGDLVFLDSCDGVVAVIRPI